MSEPNSLCFPCLEKVRTKFPVFPVPWPPCDLLATSIEADSFTHLPLQLDVCVCVCVCVCVRVYGTYILSCDQYVGETVLLVVCVCVRVCVCVHVCVCVLCVCAWCTYILSCDEYVGETVLLVVRTLMVLYAPRAGEVTLRAGRTSTTTKTSHVLNVNSYLCLPKRISLTIECGQLNVNAALKDVPLTFHRKTA